MSAQRMCRVVMLAVFVTSLVVAVSPVGAAVASSSASHLTLTGTVHGSVNVIRVVCNSHVAVAQHKFFFDLGGTSGGQSFLFTAGVSGYTGPKRYHVFTGLIQAGGHYMAGHGTGTITIGGGGNSVTVTRVILKSPPGAPPATATVNGQLTCTAYSNA